MGFTPIQLIILRTRYLMNIPFTLKSAFLVQYLYREFVRGVTVSSFIFLILRVFVTASRRGVVSWASLAINSQYALCGGREGWGWSKVPLSWCFFFFKKVGRGERLSWRTRLSASNSLTWPAPLKVPWLIQCETLFGVWSNSKGCFLHCELRHQD